MTIDITRPQHELELAFTTQRKNLLKIYVIGARWIAGAEGPQLYFQLRLVEWHMKGMVTQQ